MTKPILLMTRPENSAERFLARLSPALLQRTRVIHSPLMQIVPTGETPDLSAAAGVIFTSAQGVALAPRGIGRPAYCVGEITAKAARARAWHVRAHALTADDLVPAIEKMSPEGPLVHLAGRHRRGDIAGRLTASGTPTTVSVLYDQRLQNLTKEALAALSGEITAVVPLFSPRSAAHFATQVAPAGQIHCATLSQAVAQSLGPKWQTQVHCAPTPSGDELAQVVEMLLSRTSLT